MKVWPNGAPDTNGLSGAEEVNECIGNISEATMSVHLPEAKISSGAAVLLLSGGGYGVLCLDGEGNAMVDWLVTRGIAAIVLKYRLPNGYHQVPANDARRALRTIRYNAKEWHINPDKIGVWGFSAGGHLASTVATDFDYGNLDKADNIEHFSSKPDFTILFYPVITMEDGITNKETKNNLLGGDSGNILLINRYSNEKNIGINTPPVFLLHCSDDSVVPVENSLRYYYGLIKNKISAEMLIFEKGGHGPDAFNNNPAWQKALENWLRRRNCL